MKIEKRKESGYPFNPLPLSAPLSTLSSPTVSLVHHSPLSTNTAIQTSPFYTSLYLSPPFHLPHLLLPCLQHNYYSLSNPSIPTFAVPLLTLPSHLLSISAIPTLLPSSSPASQIKAPPPQSPPLPFPFPLSLTSSSLVFTCYVL